jgi:hypothetical protein
MPDWRRRPGIGDNGHNQALAHVGHRATGIIHLDSPVFFLDSWCYSRKPM